MWLPATLMSVIMCVIPLSGQNRVFPIGGTQPVSPSVAASVITDGTETGQVRLRLLVLWRGASGWYRANGGAGGNGGGSGSDGVTRRWAQLGGLRFEFSIDRATESASIQGRQFDLRQANVFFFDGVGAGSGTLVGTLRVEASLASAKASGFESLAPVLAIREIKEFLQ